MGTKLQFRFVLAAIAVAAVVLFVLLRVPRHEPPAQGKLKVVSLAPNVTEILFALGLGDTVIGATNACNYPPEAKLIPRVSSYGKPNVEILLALVPDLVISSGLEKPEVLAVLQQENIRVVNVQPHGFMASFPELFDAISEIGEATGREAAAQSLVASMQSELAGVAARVGAIEDTRRPRVFVEVEESPLMTAGRGSFLDDLIARAGGQNVAREIDAAYPRIDAEQVIAWDPEVILIAHSNAPGEAAKRLAEHIGWSRVAAVQQKKIIDDINPDLLFRPGPRLVEGVKQLAERLHPR
jgi:iron complex transport system substrate-binding protein